MARYLGQDELGGHSFEGPTGESFYVPDSPEARALAAQLSGVPDMRTAGRSASALSSYGKDPSQQRPAAAPSVSDASPQAINAPLGKPGRSAPAAPVGMTPKQASQASALGTDAQALAATAQDNPAAAAASLADLPDLPGTEAAAGDASSAGLTPQEQALLSRTTTAGSPGVSQAQLAKRATQGVVTPSSVTEERSGVIPVNEELELARSKAFAAEHEAERRGAENRAQAADTEAFNAEVDNHVAVQEFAKQRALIQRQAQEAEDVVTKIQDFDEAAQARYADFGPNRFFRRAGTWATIGAAISQGLGTYGMILGKTGRNPAQEIIEAAVDRDVQDQRAEYLRDRDARNNLVAELARETGDIDAATEGAKAIQHRIAMAHAQELAALSRRGDVADRWGQWEAAWQGRVVDHMQKTYEHALGNATIRTTSDVKYPVAASGGGPKSLAQIRKDEENATAIVEARAKRGEVSAGGGSLGAEGDPLFVTDGRYARTEGEGVKVRGQLADLDAADKNLEDLQNDLRANPAAPTIARVQAPLSVIGVVPSDSAAGTESKRVVATGSLGQLAGSGVVNPGEYPRLARGVGTVAGIAGVRANLQQKRKAILDSLSKKTPSRTQRRADKKQ